MKRLTKNSIIIAFTLILFCGVGTSQIPVSGRDDSDSQRMLTGTLINRSASAVKIEIAMKNTRDKTIFIATRPTTLNGKEEPSFAFEGDDLSFLKVGVQVFGKSPIQFYGNASGVELYALEPNATLKIPIVIENGWKETLPPYDSGFRALKRIRIGLLKKLRISIGYFDTPEVSHISSRRISGQSVVTLDAGKRVSLYELQKIAYLDLQI